MNEHPVGSVIAGYRIESVIGRGGMAVVYRAEDSRLGRKVALKLLTPELGAQEQFQRRFIQESRLAASLDHPNIIPIYEAGNADGVLFIAMRYVVGTDLKVAITGDVPLQPMRTLRLAEQIGDALDAAHERGLVHRDVKPGNVLLTSFHEQTDHVYLTDFGLTKRASSLTGGLTGTGHFLGTIDYVAPEQISGKPVTAQTDIYALGCVLYECLTGRVPFHRDDDAATLWAHLVDTPPPVTAMRTDLAPPVDAVISRAMAKSPSDRFQSCHEFVQQLRLALQVPAPVSGARDRGGPETAPPLGKLRAAPDVREVGRRQHPSFPPGTFPPRPRGPAHRAYESDADAEAPDYPEAEAPDYPEAEALDYAEAGALDYAESEALDYAEVEAPDDDGADEPAPDAADQAPTGDQDEESPPPGARPVRAFATRYRWLLAVAVLTLAGLVTASVLNLRQHNSVAQLPGQYTSGAQFTGVIGPFSIDTPADWSSIDDPANVDAVMSPGGAAVANLFFLTGHGASWDPVRALLKSSPTKNVGLWVYAGQNTPDRSSWKKLQDSIQGLLPVEVYFDGGYQSQTVGGMKADEMTGQFRDPADEATRLQFVLDAVQYRTPTMQTSMLLVFVAPPNLFANQQKTFDRVRQSITFH